MAQTLGKRIVQHRKRLGLTQDQLAEKLGVTAQAVSKWENDQSCPDISMLPKLAEIFGITTDALLGTAPQEPVYESEVVDEKEDPGLFHVQKGDWEFSLDSSKTGTFGFGFLVLAVGIQLILAKVLSREISFWSAAWPAALLIFGISGLFSKFSFVGLGCALFGGYFILDHWQLLPFSLGGELVFPIILVVFGLSLLVDACKKPRKPRFTVKQDGKKKDSYHADGESFEMNACFGESSKFVSLPLLRCGNISTSFGDYEIDLSGVEAVADTCRIEANCSFGELTVLVPRRYHVKLITSTASGDININGHPDQEAAGTIILEANASFGEISIRYI